METKYFSLLELLKSREWLTAVMSSTRSFVHVDISKEHLQNARLRLKEIDQELINRLMDKGWQAPIGSTFEDENFEETLKKMRENEEPEKESGE